MADSNAWRESRIIRARLTGENRSRAGNRAAQGRVRTGPAAAEPAGTPARTLARAARRSGICMLVPLALVGVIALGGVSGCHVVHDPYRAPCNHHPAVLTLAMHAAAHSSL